MDIKECIMSNEEKAILTASQNTVFMRTNILGHDVEVHRWVRPGEPVDVVYNAYVEIKNSRYLKKSYIGYDITLQEDDILGVDSAKNWASEYEEHDKLRIVLDQIQGVIEKVLEVLEVEEE
jgi:hypothetical protein